MGISANTVLGTLTIHATSKGLLTNMFAVIIYSPKKHIQSLDWKLIMGKLLVLNAITTDTTMDKYIEPTGLIEHTFPNGIKKLIYKDELCDCKVYTKLNSGTCLSCARFDGTNFKQPKKTKNEKKPSSKK